MWSPMRTDWFFISEGLTSDVTVQTMGGVPPMVSSVNNVKIISHPRPLFIGSKHKLKGCWNCCEIGVNTAQSGQH